MKIVINSDILILHDNNDVIMDICKGWRLD